MKITPDPGPRKTFESDVSQIYDIYPKIVDRFSLSHP